MPPRYGYGPPRQLSFGGPLTPAVKGLLIANVGIFIVERLVYSTDAWHMMLALFALNPVLLFKNFFLWQLVTYMFLHSPSAILHIVFNMLILWMFGCEIERVWGPRRFLRYYFITGVGAGLAHCVFGLFRSNPVLGASGAIFGIFVAYAMLFPTRTVLFMLIIPMKARQLVLILAGIELLSVGSMDGVAHLAHLGGALTGYLMLKGLWAPRRILEELKWKMRRRRFRTIRDDDPPRGPHRRDRDYPFH